MATVKGRDGFYFFPKDVSEEERDYVTLQSATSISLDVSSSVTTQPVVGGAIITDNYQSNPRKLVVDGIVTTDSVLGAVREGVTTSLGFEGRGRDPTDLVSIIDDLKDKARLVSVFGGQGLSILSAVIISASYQRDNKISNGLRVSLTFQEVLTSSSLEQATVTVDQGAAQTDKGGNNPTKSDAILIECADIAGGDLNSTDINVQQAYAACVLTRSNNKVKSDYELRRSGKQQAPVGGL